ncbi:UbiA family prenyltransferase [Rhodobacterales bacterium HKCCE2091]|nr:UbiA family prenyltransferase [Rhodobacterales bacterium HKCCE2091]
MRVLAVDLDDTLLKGDMLYETFWAALARNWTNPFRAAAALPKGPAAVKRVLADAARIEAADLPYDKAVVDRVRAWREAGGTAILVTASDQSVADAVADHVGLFDSAHGSDGSMNLKGPTKAEFLAARYGRGGFAYMGDSSADLAVWSLAGAAITVGATRDTRRKVDATGLPVEHIERPAAPKSTLFEAMRPHQWMKNVLVFVPLVANQEFEPWRILWACAAFVSMCMMASAGYMLNDLLDLADDRNHPRKCNRPFASGRLPVPVGTILVPSLLAAGLSLAFMFSELLAVVIFIYFIATTAYSVKLKEFALIDVFLLATLYTSRIIAGGVAIWVELSIWLLAFSMFFFLSLAAVKRQAELIEAESVGRTRKQTRRGYRVEDRSMVTHMAVASGYSAVLVLALYLREPDVLDRYGAPYLMWLVCPILLYWISRMVLTAGRGDMHDDPLIYAVQSRTSRRVLVLVAVLIFAAIVL